MTTPTLLVAVENDATRTFLVDNLDADGYRTVVATDMPGALCTLGGQPIDLVLADIGSDTLALLDAVRDGRSLAERYAPAMPLIVLAGYADRQAGRYYARGCSDLIRKPFSYLKLRARVRAQVGSTSGALA